MSSGGLLAGLVAVNVAAMLLAGLLIDWLTRRVPVLVLSRQEGEELVIGGGDGRIIVRVVEVRGRGVRLAIEAPRNVAVHRRELLERVRQDNRRLEAEGDGSAP